MKKEVYISILLMLFSFLAIPTIAQDPHFSQFYAAPIYMNPAYAGTTYNPKIHLNFRDQWPALSHAFLTYAASYDQYFSALHGGIAVMVMGDRAGGGIYNTYNIKATYAYQLNITEAFAIKAGMSGGFVQRRLDMQKVFFYDQIDPVTGFETNGIANPTVENIPLIPVTSFADFDAGILAYSKNAFVGFSTSHITQPDEGILNYSAQLPIKYTAHGGAVLHLNKKKDGNATFSPNFMYTQQVAFRQLNVGSYFKKGIIFGGIWLRHNIENIDAVIFLVGLQKNVVKFGYSYDLTLGDLAGKTGGAHELSLIFNYDELESATFKKARDNSLKCPPLY